MNIELIHRPGNTAAKVSLNPGEICTAEAGAMIAMSGNMDVTTSTHKKGSRGLLKAPKRVVAGESLFLNHFEPKAGPGAVWLGPNLAGDLIEFDREGREVVVPGGPFLAC